MGTATSTECAAFVVLWNITVCGDVQNSSFPFLIDKGSNTFHFSGMAAQG